LSVHPYVLRVHVPGGREVWRAAGRVDGRWALAALSPLPSGRVRSRPL